MRLSGMLVHVCRTSAFFVTCVALSATAQPPAQNVAPQERARTIKSAQKTKAVDGHRLMMSRNPHRKAPAWVPAALAFDAEGLPSPQQFMPYEIGTVKRMGREPMQGQAMKDPCQAVMTFDDIVGPSPEPNLRALAASAHAIHLGRVVEIIPGFYAGLPSSVFRVSIEPAAPVQREVLFLHPTARFIVKGREYCRRNLDFGEPPAVGDTVLLFARETVDADRILYAPLPYEVISQRDGKALQLPRLLKGDTTSQTADITTLAKVARGLARELRR